MYIRVLAAGEAGAAHVEAAAARQDVRARNGADDEGGGVGTNTQGGNNAWRACSWVDGVTVGV